MEAGGGDRAVTYVRETKCGSTPSKTSQIKIQKKMQNAKYQIQNENTNYKLQNTKYSDLCEGD